MKKASYAMKLDTKPRIIEIELNKEILNKKRIAQIKITKVNHLINEVLEINLSIIIFKVNLINPK
jgi:hypothetical protein